MAHEHQWQPVVNLITQAMGIPPDQYYCICGAERKLKFSLKGKQEWKVRDARNKPWCDE